MMTPMRTVILAALCSVLAACASSKAARGVDVEGPEIAEETKPSKPGEAGAPKKDSGPPQPNVPQISNRAKLLFEDGLKAMKAQRKSGKLDYEALERKFEQALDADGNLAEAAFNLGVLAERRGRKDDA